MIKAVIIDDEMQARESIISLVSLCCSQVDIVDQAESVEEGILAIHKNKPDLVFLDIQMPDGTGFDLLKQLNHIDFKVIFITAFEEYAIQAFKFSAIDYLLKPINPREFAEAVNKVEQLKESEEFRLKLDAFFSNMNNVSKDKKKIVLKTQESIYLVNVNDIVRCESDKNYTEFYLNNNKKIVVSKVLKEYEELLADYDFVRPHQSHLVNLNYIESYIKEDGGFIKMSDQASIPVSTRKKESILRLFENL